MGVGFGVFSFLWASVCCACRALWVFFFPLGFWLVIPVYMSCVHRGALCFSIKLL